MSRFLLVRLGALGDIVHAIPVAAALRRAFPSARIDWLVGAKHRDILDLVPVIDRRLVLGASTHWPAAIAELRRAHYDVAIDIQGLLKSALLARSSGAPRIVGFSSSYLRERAARLFYSDTHDPEGPGLLDPQNRLHQVRINLGLLEPLGVTVVEPEFPLEAIDSKAAAEVRSRVGDSYAVLNPGAAWPNKRWPADRFGKLAQAVFSRHGVKSIVTWGPGEEGLAFAVVAASGGGAEAAPKTTVADLLALLRGARLIVSGDTGPVHLAAAVGTPVVALYGPTRPARNGPWGDANIVVSRDQVCQCVHLRRCRLQTMCLADVSVDEVDAAVTRRLSIEGRRA